MAKPFTPFVEIEGNPPPPRMSGGSVVTRDRKRIRYAIARPAGPTRGTVLLLQGRNETIEKYFETMGDLVARGFTVATFDWRSQGGSQRLLRDPRKGHVRSIRNYISDLECVLQDVVLPDCRGPYVVLAHSMGGLVALAAVPQLVNRIERIVLSAPLVTLPEARWSGLVPALCRALTVLGLGRLAVRRLRRGGKRASLEHNPLTGDERRFRRNRALLDAAPHLFVESLTASWMSAANRAMRRLRDSDVIARMHLPTLIVTAGDDRVVGSKAAERLAWRMRSGHSLRIAGARHELLQERDLYREQFLAAFEAFVGSVMPMPVPLDMPPIRLTEAELIP